MFRDSNGSNGTSDLWQGDVLRALQMVMISRCILRGGGKKSRERKLLRG